MRTCTAPGVSGLVDRTCPRCGGRAKMHGRLVRAVHDWMVTFIDCERLRCCGRTWTATPDGLTPRARYSDRVLGLSRVLAQVGVALREQARLFTATGVPVTPPAVAGWCRGVSKRTSARVVLSPRPEGQINLYLRPGLWLAFETRSPRQVKRILTETLKVQEVTLEETAP